MTEEQYETPIDDLLHWLKNNHYLSQTEETIQKITDQFYFWWVARTTRYI